MTTDSVLVTISLDLPEIGVRGEAVVTGLEPCPAILPGPGKVVLTTFHHASSDLIDLYLSPQPPAGGVAGSLASTSLNVNSAASSGTALTQPSIQTSEEALLYPRASRATSIDPSWERIGVTGNHPIWSQDRHDYVAAMDLRLGERLKNLSGDTVWVQQKFPRPGPTPVYNLEVQDEHVYYVGASGVLAHNACDNKGLGGFENELSITPDAARRHLRRNLSGSGGQAHHIIPFASRGHELVQRAARGGFNMNGANNGIRLQLTQHLGSHPKYSAGVTRKLNKILQANLNISDTDAARLLQSYVDQLRAGLNRSSSMLH